MTKPDESPNLTPLTEIDRLIHDPAWLAVMALLYVVGSADFILLINQTGLTWCNLSAHMGKLEEAGYLIVEKTLKSKRPNTLLRLTSEGREAFSANPGRMGQLFKDLSE